MKDINMMDGVYIGKGFDLTYLVTKLSDEEYSVLCRNNNRTHHFKGNRLYDQIRNFLNNHKLIKED